MAIRKQPEMVNINLGKVRLLSSLKQDLELYIEFLKECVKEEFRVADVLLGCLEQEVNGNAEFRKFKARRLEERRA